MATLLRASVAARRKGSLLTVALFAVASFMLASVAMQNRGVTSEAVTGGYALRVTCTVAPGYDISTVAGRQKLGFTSADEAALSAATVLPLWSQGAGDVSCLNLARPNTVRVLGVEPGALSASGLRLRTEAPGSDWAALEGSAGDAIPVIGDSESMTWILKRSLGETFELPRDGAPPLRVRLVGLVDGGLFAGDLLMGRKAMAAAYGETGGAAVFLISAAADQLPAVRESAARNLAPFGCQIESTADITSRVHSVQRLYMSFFFMLGAAGLLLGAAGQAAVMIRQCFQRRSEMQILLAHGFTRGRVIVIFFGEQTVLLLAGVVTGGASALLPGVILLDGASATGIAAVLLTVLVAGGMAIAMPLWLLTPQARDVRLAFE